MKRDSLDALFSRYIRTRDRWTCQRCGKVYPPPTTALHCAHVFSRGKQSTRFDPMNAVALCYGCHRFMDQHKESNFFPWHSRRIGIGFFDQLMVRAHTPRKPDRIMISLWLKQELKG